MPITVTEVGGERLELSWLAPTDPKSALSTSFSNRPYSPLGIEKISLQDDTSAHKLLSRQTRVALRLGYFTCLRIPILEGEKML